jgi:hypothetical protein
MRKRVVVASKVVRAEFVHFGEICRQQDRHAFRSVSLSRNPRLMATSMGLFTCDVFA